MWLDISYARLQPTLVCVFDVQHSNNPVYTEYLLGQKALSSCWLLYWSSLNYLVYPPFGQSNIYSTLDFCLRPARKETNVPITKRSWEVTVLIYILCLYKKRRGRSAGIRGETSFHAIISIALLRLWQKAHMKLRELVSLQKECKRKTAWDFKLSPWMHFFSQHFFF